MLSKIQSIIAEELKAAESQILTRLKPLPEEQEEDEFGGTFESTAHLYIP